MAGKAVFIQSEELGKGDTNLGRLLMANFLRILGENPETPDIIVLWNGGVRLACEGSSLVGYLKKLNDRGVEILACTTCLEYLDLGEKLLVGKPSTMAKSIEAMMHRQVITL